MDIRKALKFSGPDRVLGRTKFLGHHLSTVDCVWGQWTFPLTNPSPLTQGWR